MARRWPAGDRRDQGNDSVKSLSLRDIMPKAGVAELADARDLKSRVPKGACGSDSHPRHQEFLRLLLFGARHDLADCSKTAVPTRGVGRSSRLPASRMSVSLTIA